jgi:hypothetical protein
MGFTHITKLTQLNLSVAILQKWDIETRNQEEQAPGSSQPAR